MERVEEKPLKQGSGRFILGIESLTGLVAGASALVALVAALVLWLMISDARSAMEASAYSRAELIASSLGSRPSQINLENIARPSIPGGGVRAVAVVSGDSLTIAYPPVSSNEIHSGNHVTYSSQAGYTVYLLMELPAVLAGGPVAVVILSLFAVFLTLVAVLMPRYLRRSVLEPLRNILGQADRLSKGSGSSALAADDSFMRLVDLIARQDEQLNDMREKAIRRAETAESRSGEVLEAMGSSVVVLDSENCPTLWNMQAESLMNLSGEESGAPELLAPFIRRGVTEWDSEEAGRNYRFKVTQGKTDERVVLITDVTASLQLERRLSEESALADLGAFSGGVAHEIGNALCALEGFIQLLARGSESLRTREILEEASMEVDSARKIVNSFRQISTESSIESSFQVEEAFQTIENACESRAVRCISESVKNLYGMLPGNPVLLGRILDNLLSNALRYSPPEEVRVTAVFNREGCGFIFTVEDNGPGLPEKTEIVFRPMYTTEEKTGGMGLGLTIVRRLAGAMGGSVTAGNRAEGGAVFTVTIPCIGEEQ